MSTFHKTAGLARVAVLAAILALPMMGCPDDDGVDPDCTAGTAGCECGAGSECATGLVCNSSNMCEAEACTPGETGCECATGDTCTSSSDECTAGVCGPRTSCEGELGCACDGGSCDTGLTCEADVCTADNVVLISLSGGDARACDLVVETTGRKVADISFPAGYRGKMRTRDLKTAIAVIRTADTAIDGVTAALVFEGDDAVADGEASVTTTSCYGRLGAADSGVTATIQ